VPKYRAQGPDGRTYQVDAPDEATARAHIKRAATQRMQASGYSDFAGGLATVGQGLTNGGYDEVQGGLRGGLNAVTGAARDIGQGRNPLPGIGGNYRRGYRAGADQTREFEAAFAHRQPWLAPFLRGTGGAAPLAATMVVAPQAAPTVAARQFAASRPLVTAATVGAGYGATGHVLGGITPEERFAPGGVLKDAAIGAGVGTVLHTGARAVGPAVDTVGGVISRFGLNPQQRGARLLARDLEDAGMTPEAFQKSAAARRRRTGGTTAVTVAEVGGAPMARTARAVNAVRGPGQQISDDALTARATGLDPERIVAMKESGLPLPPDTGTRAGRVASALSKGFRRTGSSEPMDVFEARRSIDRAREAQADAGYRMAYSREVSDEQAAVLQQAIDGMDPKVVQQAAKTAQELARLDRSSTTLQARLGERRAPRLRQVRTEIDALMKESRGAGGKKVTPKRREEIADRIEQLRDEEAFLRRSVDKAHNEAVDTAHLDEAGKALEALAAGRQPQRLSVASVDYLHRAFGQMADEAAPGSQFQRAYGSHKSVLDQIADDMFPEYAEVRNTYRTASSRQEFLEHGQNILTMSEGELRSILRGQNGRQPSVHELDDLVAGALDAVERKLAANELSAVRSLLRNRTWQAVIERTIGKTEARRLMRVIQNEVRMATFANDVRGGSQTARIKEDVDARTTGEAEMGFLDDAADAGFDPGKMVGALGRRVYDRFRRGGIANPKVNEAVARYLYAPATEGNVSRLAADINGLPRYARLAGSGKKLARRAPLLVPPAVLVEQNERRKREPR